MWASSYFQIFHKWPQFNECTHFALFFLKWNSAQTPLKQKNSVLFHNHSHKFLLYLQLCSTLLTISLSILVLRLTSTKYLGPGPIFILKSLQGTVSLCAAASGHPSATAFAISSPRWNDLEIIGTKRLPACQGMQSVLYIHMYWTQTCHRLWQPHSSHTKPILSAAQCAPPSPCPPSLHSKWQHWNEH